jgi:molybdopterin-containing oxidoreductase family iron-sulfur binding subunit
MVIDIAKCIGCHACTIGCVAENKLPPGVVYRVVLEEETGQYPQVRRRFVPRPCLHCQNPPCVKACPVTATYKDEQGVVVMNYERCIGCRYCLVACPYAARTAIYGGYCGGTRSYPKAVEPRRRRTATSRIRRRNKRNGRPGPHSAGNLAAPFVCTGKWACHRVAPPRIGRATIFGDRTDPKSLVFEMIGSPRVFRLKEELGTLPSVYYLR